MKKAREIRAFRILLAGDGLGKWKGLAGHNSNDATIDESQKSITPVIQIK
jgi:hypothetical protein